MPDTEALQKEFIDGLRDVWREWHEHDGGSAGPFVIMDSIPYLEERAGYNYTVGWVLGVADAMGWSTDDPTPKGRKDWDPRR